MRRLIVIFFLAVTATAVGPTLAAGDGERRSRAVLVTGASSGIGKQIALTLADNGYYVFAGARKARDIEALSALDHMQGLRLDVTVPAEIAAAVETVQQSGYNLVGLVNNAGVFLYDPLIEVSEADLEFIMDVNVFGPYRVTRAFAPLLMEHRGRITTIGSIAGIASGRLMGPYGMSKHAMESFTDSLAAEMAKFDVQVSVVEPGNFRSDIMANMRQRSGDRNKAESTSLFAEEIDRFASFSQVDRSKHQAPTPVADAVLNFLSADQPKRRYLVAPNAGEAQFTIRKAFQRALELNADQPFTLSRTELVTLLDELLATVPAASPAVSQQP